MDADICTAFFIFRRSSGVAFLYQSLVLFASHKTYHTGNVTPNNTSAMIRGCHLFPALLFSYRSWQGTFYFVILLAKCGQILIRYARHGDPPSRKSPSFHIVEPSLALVDRDNGILMSSHHNSYHCQYNPELLCWFFDFLHAAASSASARMNLTMNTIPLQTDLMLRFREQPVLFCQLH